MYNWQIKIFLLVGLATVTVDFLIYRSLLSLFLMEVNFAKGFGFTGGVLFAYFSNRFWGMTESEQCSDFIFISR